MSDIPDYRDRLDLQEQIARIDKLMSENHKLQAERDKLQAERDKFNRDPWLLTLAALIAAFAVLLGRLPELLHAAGMP